MAAYIGWTVGDTISFGVKVEDFCGTNVQNLYFGSMDIQKYPNPLTITCVRPNCAYSCIDTASRHLIIRSFKNFTPSNNDAICNLWVADKYYRELGRITTDIQGIATLNYTVTEQDRLDYIDATSGGGSYHIVVCTGDTLFLGHAIRFDGITISQNLCLGVSCPDTCFGQDLWSMKCDPLTGNCIQDALKQANSPVCTASHYIEYDLNFLPATFLNLVATNIVDLSNFLGSRLPMPGNIQWGGATYSGGKFRMYVVYTAPSAVQGLALPQMALPTFAGITAGIIVFAIAQRLTIVAGPVYSTIIGAALGITAAITLGYIIHEIVSGITTPGTAPQQTPVDKSNTVNDYIKNYVIPFCNQQYPGCVTVPPTCDGPTYRAYAACIQLISQCQYDAALKGDPVTTCDPRVQEYQAIDDGLANGTMTPQEAQQRTTTNNTTINNYHNEAVQSMTCPSGQTYDKTVQKCVQSECWIPGFTPGSCILTPNSGKKILILGGVLVGGLFLLRAVRK